MEDTTPHYYRPIKPHNCRRARFHDYKAPGCYLITISKAPSCQNFSSLAGKPFEKTNPPRVEVSKIGQIIEYQIAAINEVEIFNVDNYVVMPDHIHILWRVKSRLPRDLGYYIGLFKSRCTKAWHESDECRYKTSPMFLPKFNDRIGFDKEIIIRFSNYIDDNPRRRLIVKTMPQLFSRKHQLRIGNRIMDAYGNFQLLRHPMISAVIVSKRYTDDQRMKLEAEWEECIRTGGVLVSPFISEVEQKIMVRGIEAGASIVRILPDGIPPKYKPYKRDFELCMEGRCLHIGVPRPSARNEKLTRREALDLNNLARWIVSRTSTDKMGLILD